MDRHLLNQGFAFYDSKIETEKLWFKLQTLETEKLGHIYDIAHDNLILSIFFRFKL